MAIDKSTDLWPWYKEILATVEAALVQKHPESRAKLEMVLKDAENDFKNLLQNPALTVRMLPVSGSQSLRESVYHVS